VRGKKGDKTIKYNEEFSMYEQGRIGSRE